MNTHALTDGSQENLANGLGWFSIGLGLAEVLAPDRVAQLIGVRDTDGTRSLLRFYGFRELAAGAGILMQPRPAGWMWARVAGDLVDLATLGSALNSETTDRTRLMAASAAVLGVTALDVLCARELSNGTSQSAGEHYDRISRVTAIDCSPEEAYRFWHDFENLPRFMKHVESVRVTGPGRSQWRTSSIAGKAVEWEAEIVDDQANSRIAWRSLPGSDFDHSGAVHFERAPGGRGTLVRVEFCYAAPGGAVTNTIAKMIGAAPGQQIEEDLRRFKQIIETGEIVMSDASIHTGMHAAQPSAV